MLCNSWDRHQAFYGTMSDKWCDGWMDGWMDVQFVTFTDCTVMMHKVYFLDKSVFFLFPSTHVINKSTSENYKLALL